jgi:hypothetical protein
LSPIESLISDFVEDLLLLLREAKVGDLLDLVAEAPRPIPALVDSEPEEEPVVEEPLEEPPRTPVKVRVIPPRVRRERRPAAVTRTRLAAVTPIGRRAPRIVPTVEEITDPASLLAFGPESSPSAIPQPPPTLPALLADPVDDIEVPPPSSSQESRVLVRLNSNETVARASNAGIVIRRRKA